MRSTMAVVAVLVMAGCGSVVDINDDGGSGHPDAHVGNMTCKVGSDCDNGICVDGFCCDTTCDGVCEACNVTGSEGTCTAVPAKTDPAMECVPLMLSTVDAGDVDGGTQVNIPDAGVGAMATPCLPSCNGARACGFPDATTSCGDTFCNTSSQVGAAVCDGAGHCGVEVNACNAYVCSGAGVCKTSCASDADCQTGFYCGSADTCEPKKVLGQICESDPDECQSNFCENNVCCNSHCSAIPGGQCNVSGSVGMCKCQVNAMDCNGSCELYYIDADSDGYGSAKDPGIVGCTGDPSNPPPAGRIAASAVTSTGAHKGNTDCGDDDMRVNPGQVSYQTAAWTSAWRPFYDWNCDGVVSPQYAVLPGSACEFCNPQSESIISIIGGTCGGTEATCAAANQHQYFNCAHSEIYCGTTHRGFCANACCGLGCSEVEAGVAFAAIVYGAAYAGAYNGCSQSSTLTVCGACSMTNGPADTGALSYSNPQGCL